MAQPRRMGAEDSEVRARFIDALEAVLCEDGSHGVSARRVAEKAGLKTQLLYYYFRTMDDLLLALVRRANERRMERFETALASPEPLRALWRLNIDPSAAALAAELTSIAHHRDSIRTEIVESAKRFRALQTEAVARLLPPDEELDGTSASGIVMIAVALSRTLAAEAALGLTEGHEEALKIADRLIARFEAARPRG